MKKVIKWLLYMLVFLQGSLTESMHSMLSRATTAARRNVVSSSLSHNRVHVQRRFSDQSVEAVHRQSHKQTIKNENFNSDHASWAPTVLTATKPSFDYLGLIVASLCGLFGFGFSTSSAQQVRVF